MNELMTFTEFEVSYTPSEITMKNEAQLESMVEKTAEYYQSLVFTDEKILEAKQARKELNDIFKMIDDKRKAVKNDYNAPLVEFESKMTNFSKRIKSVSDEIGKGIKSFEEKERLEREEQLKDKIAEIAESKGVTAESIEIQKSWTNKTGFLGKKMLEEIETAADLAFKELQRVAADKKVIASLATVHGLEPDSWVEQVENGMPAAELIPMVEQAVKRKKEREAEEERQRIANEEYKVAMAEVEKANQVNVGGRYIDRETGEVVEIVDDTPTHPEAELSTVVLQLTGSQAQFIELNQKIVELGIQVQKVG